MAVREGSAAYRSDRSPALASPATASPASASPSSPAPPEERDAVQALASLAGLGPVRIARLLAEAGSTAEPTNHAVAQSALCVAVPDARERARLLTRVSEARAACAHAGIRVVTCVEAEYPTALRDLEDAPPVLYLLGTPGLTRGPSVALVGSRQATGYGRHVARDFAWRLAQRGICVVSGLAAGIDAESHAAALEGGGPTIAVQGTGVDVAYPRSNAALHARIAREGLVVSELPPGRPAHPGAFPRRNRLIAALADVVIVIEAGVRSGALITAQLGGEIGRLVGAVPGPIDADSSRGANQLLRDGVHAIASFDDVLGLLALTPRGREGGARRTEASAPEASRGDAESRSEPRRPQAIDESSGIAPGSLEGRVLAVLVSGAQRTDDLVRACGISPRDVATALSVLELQGEVVIDAAGLVRRVVPRGGRGR